MKEIMKNRTNHPAMIIFNMYDPISGELIFNSGDIVILGETTFHDDSIYFLGSIANGMLLTML